jgi:hypothetical protein
VLSRFRLKKRVWPAVLLASGACSLLVQFDPESQACGPNDTCLEGFRCVEKRCRRQVADAGVTPQDGGTEAARWDEFSWDSMSWQ